MNFVFDKKRPPLVAMVQNETVEDALNTITDALYDGADAFGIQLEDLLPQYRNLEDLKKIFAACMGKPTYITSYRSHNSKGYTDEQCMELLLLGAEAGGDLCDIMGDTFDPQQWLATVTDRSAVSLDARKVQVQGNLDVTKPGCYQLIYSYDDGKLSGQSPLTVVVTERQA